MPTLFRTGCNSDWKCRPTHTLTALGTGTREELVLLQDQDVARWQAEDIEQARLDAEPGEVVSDTWPIVGERWEMDRKKPEDLRVFAGSFDDGGCWSTVYHILD